MNSAPLALHLGPHPALAGLFPAFAGLSYPLLLDSAMPHPRLGRFSYLAADPFMTAAATEDGLLVDSEGRRSHMAGDSFALLQALMAIYRMEPVAGGSLPPFQGGAVGYFAYDLGRRLERLPSIAVKDIPAPDLHLAFYDWVLAQDATTGQTWLFSTGWPHGTSAYAQERAEAVRRLLCQPHERHGAPLDEPRLTAPLTSTFTRAAYVDAVCRVKDYLYAGDCYQVNLSQRLEAPFAGDPWELYKRIRKANPAPYGAYLAMPDMAVLSASPELFLRVEGRHVETRPIKGTRPRGLDVAEDQRLAQELAASAKDRAENVMIVDLLRNDLGRVCEVGSVKVPELFALEAHPSVWHLVSTVTGELPSGKDPLDLLRAAFPGGSVTGAPKIRAMEIIEELEPVRRGLYCGAMGFLAFNGDMEASIIIRTALVTSGRFYLQVGGAIVADSDPEAEYQETLHKARGILAALEHHEDGRLVSF